jgi:arsenite oxidase small subunit
VRTTRIDRSHGACADLYRYFIGDVMSVSRRRFLKLTGVAAAAGTTAVPASPAQNVQADIGRTTLPYVPKVIAHTTQLQDNVPVQFSFPDESSPCTLIKMGTPVPGGVGPAQDIVAYSALCTHMGCPVSYDPATAVFTCPCHFSMFDAEKCGQMISGHATAKLPAVTLEYSTTDGAVRAIAIDGLIYGRQANLL